jgi:hypothetical protein
MHQCTTRQKIFLLLYIRASACYLALAFYAGLSVDDIHSFGGVFFMEEMIHKTRRASLDIPLLFVHT